MVSTSTAVYLLTVDCLRDDYVTEEFFDRCWGRFSEDFARFPKVYSNGVATPLSFPRYSPTNG